MARKTTKNRPLRRQYLHLTLLGNPREYSQLISGLRFRCWVCLLLNFCDEFRKKHDLWPRVQYSRSTSFNVVDFGVMERA